MAASFPNAASMPSLSACALALAAGVLGVQWLPRLEASGGWVLALLLLAWGLTRGRHRWSQLLAWVLLGVAWAAWQGGQGMRHRLPPALEGHDFIVEGRLLDLPRAGGGASSFLFQAIGTHPWSGRLRLTWYHAPPLRACQRWHLHLRLRRPRGLANPGPADTERSALSHHLVAVGYVRPSRDNRLLATSHCIDGAREWLARAIAARLAGRDAALLQALAVGDTRGLSGTEWAIARANGIAHLLAISGFHVGVAALAASWLVRLVYSIWPPLALYHPRPMAQTWVGLLAALVYSALAGFGIATVRSLLMLAALAWQRLCRQERSSSQALALALIILLLADPLAVLAAGFWLSFAGVALLLYALPPIGDGKGWRRLHELGRHQLLMSFSLLPLGQWFFGEASLLSACSNFLAMPWVSFVLLPLLLAALPALLCWPWLADRLLQLAGWAADGLWWWLQLWAAGPGAHWYAPTPSGWRLLAASLGGLWLFLPRGIPLRWLGLWLLLPLGLPTQGPPAPGAFEIWVLDVGQGLAVLLRTRHHVLIYDTGPRYPSGFDLGAAVVLPALHALAWRGPDRLIVSHGDNDHAGGAAAIVAVYPQLQRYAGEPARLPFVSRVCRQGQHWEWDGVSFEMLWPTWPAALPPGNARSCVLRVRSRSGQLLLPGDLPAHGEEQLLAAVAAQPTAVLVVPHHGSRTASSPALLAALRPQLALVSSGWHNRFHHPHPQVVARYRAAGIALWNTAEEGALQVIFPAAGPPRLVRRWRRFAARYWRE